MSTETLTAILVAAIVANLVVMVALVGVLLIRARRVGKTVATAPATGIAESTLSRRLEDVTGHPIQPGVGRAIPAGEPSASIAETPPVASAEAAPEAPPLGPSPGLEPVMEDPALRGMLVDAGTGLDSRLAWERAIREEEARLARYGRPATIVLAEIDGLERLVDRLGLDAADRVLFAVAATLRRSARAADRVARLGPARFGAILPETDEIQAVNFVERVRAACDVWLEASGVALRIALGWASPVAGGDLASALRTADSRLVRERRRAVPDVSGTDGGRAYHEGQHAPS